MRLALRRMFLLVALPGVTFAQADGASLASRRAQVVAAAPQGPVFQSSGQDYRVVLGVRAGEARPEASGAPHLVAAETSGPDVLEVKGRYVIYRERNASPSAAGARSFAVAVNTRSGALGVITGTVVGKVASVAEAERAARAAGATLEFFAESTGYAFFQVPAGGDPFAVAAALRARPGLAGVQVEVRERNNQPR